ncbi:MAG: hypothetical protein M3Y24_05690 [Acidobacteriota bacterium]|nr:hypothetical protein [Acidobacteriota bacterium]
MPTTNESNVVAVFDRFSDAQDAVKDLQSQGFGLDRIYISDEGAATAAESVAANKIAPNAAHHETGMKHWLHAVFGVHDHADKPIYVRAVAGGKTVVSVHAPNPEIARISEVLNRHSPIGVHEENYGAGKGISTPNTDSTVIEPGKPDLLNALDELKMEKSGVHPTGTSSIRVYPRVENSGRVTPLE